MKSLHAKIGELTLENDFLEVALGKAGLLSEAMIMREHELSIITAAPKMTISLTRCLLENVSLSEIAAAQR